jgi:hypothetical protein
MRFSAFFGLFFLGVACGYLPSRTNAAASVAPISVNTAETEPDADLSAKIDTLHQAWASEHDPAKRHDLGEQLVDAVIRDYAHQPVEVADEVARDGAPRNLILPPASAETIAITPLTILNGAHMELDDPRSPVFRRITANRLEAWTSTEGWLFDGQGRLLVDVKVPRRDGTGREWFGAFLPKGNWITTDIWANDQQLNCYSPSGKWKWELPGAKILTKLPKPNPYEGEWNEPIIDWGRSDRTGRKWLVSVGANLTRGFALVNSDGHVQPLAYDVSLWSLIYPRAMGVRGGYVAFYIDSDDAKISFHFNTVAHGPFCTWPNFSLSPGWSKTIYEGTNNFGFWPQSHDVYVEVPDRVPEPWHTSPNTWFFAKSGKYQGEIAGSYLADAANGHDLLLKDESDHVLQVANQKTEIFVAKSRAFTWPDGTQAVPLAIYDDLKLGFFLRGPGTLGFTDDARRACADAQIVFAHWKD